MGSNVKCAAGEHGRKQRKKLARDIYIYIYIYREREIDR